MRRMDKASDSQDKSRDTPLRFLSSNDTNLALETR
jgi:hypothetical protein